MANRDSRRRIWGWMFFDWASQPYNTLLITFIFGPYINELLGDGSRAQAAWGFGIGAAGVAIAILAPILGAMADSGGSRMRWIRVFSALYLVGAAGLWLAAPGAYDLWLVLGFFALGLVGMEMATIFTNAMLPDLGPRGEIGRISGSGWAFGYLGGLISLVLMLLFFAENATTGRTLIGIEPLFGLDPAQREGTRFVGPFTALWFAAFMVPFFAYVREPDLPRAAAGATRRALRDLGRTIASLPARPSLFSYLGASMFYRDGLNGLYAFGGIYAAGVLGWGVTDVGVFGILAIVAGAIFAWIGGRIDSARGPKPVIRLSIAALTLAGVAIIFIGPDRLFGMDVAGASHLPTLAFYAVGVVVGAAGGTLQAASRTMMVHQADEGRMTEAFGLYALSGKATSFLAPLSVGTVTAITGSQQWGVVPIIVLFLAGAVLLAFVQPDGDRVSR